MKNKSLLFVFAILLALSGTHFKCSEKEIASIDTVLVANQHFSFDLYQELMKEKGNLFFSPYSISSALAMTYAGAEAETKQQMAKVLHFNPEYKQLHESYGLLNDSLMEFNHESVELIIANGLWADSRWNFLESYIELIKTRYKSEITSIDMGDAANTANIINEWIERKTNSKIKEIVNENDFELARLVLANAIYFKGTWKSTFDKEKTRTMDFILHEKTTQQADFMFMINDFNYFEDENVQVVEIPYAGQELSMLVVLPGKRKGIRNIEETLTFAQYESWLNALHQTKLDLYIPKFTLDYDKELNDVLKAMGMPLAFSRMADFSGMTGKKDLQIDKVKHKSFVEVNEEGTEAAAATVVIIREKSAAITKEFKANRPFIFFIKENLRNSILFMGRVENPQTVR